MNPITIGAITMTTIFLNTYKLDLANEMDAHCWELMQARQAVRGLHKTVLPWNTKRPEKCGYDMYPCGHHRITPAGEIFYDWVVYDNARIKAGYILELVDIPPLAAPPADEVPMVPHALTDAPSRTAQAVEWLQAEPGRTQAAAAALFDITQPAISAALTRISKR